jgi:hypothetical protein
VPPLRPHCDPSSGVPAVVRVRARRGGCSDLRRRPRVDRTGRAGACSAASTPRAKRPSLARASERPDDQSSIRHRSSALPKENVRSSKMPRPERRTPPRRPRRRGSMQERGSTAGARRPAHPARAQVQQRPRRRRSPVRPTETIPAPAMARCAAWCARSRGRVARRKPAPSSERSCVLREREVLRCPYRGAEARRPSHGHCARVQRQHRREHGWTMGREADSCRMHGRALPRIPVSRSLCA